MADIATTTTFIDGSANLQNQLSIVDGQLSVAPQTALRSNGAFVGNDNPLPARAPAQAGSYSTVAEAYHVLKAAPGALMAISVNATVSGMILLLDAAALPPDGAVSPRRAWFYDYTTRQTIDKTFDPPLAMAEGAILAFSTGADSFTLTIGGAVCQFSGEII